MEKEFVYIMVLMFAVGLAVLITNMLRDHREKKENECAPNTSRSGDDSFSCNNKSECEKPMDSEELTGNKSEESDRLSMTEEEYFKRFAKEQRELIFKALGEMGCKPDENEDEKDERIFFKYQGIYFCIIQNKKFIRIWDLPYSNISILDTNMPIVIEAINKANFGFGPTVVMTEADEDGFRKVESRMDVLFISTIPNPANYLSAILDNFINMRNSLRSIIDEYVRLSDNQETKQKENSSWN